MTLDITPSGIHLTAGAEKATRPIWVNPELCHTAEIPDGTATGGRLQHDQSYFLHYRLTNISHWSPIHRAESTGTLRMIMHYPTRRDAGDQPLAIMMWVKPVDELSWYVQWRDGFGSGVYGDLFAGAGATVPIFCQGSVTYAPPTGAGVDSMKVIEFTWDNCYPQMVAAYHLSDLVIPESQLLVGPGDCGPGRFIATKTDNYVGLVTGIGDGADDVESIERMTRRTFFNQSHPDGSELNFADSLSTWENMFTAHSWRAKARDLFGTGDPVNCYPAAVAMVDSRAAPEAKLRFTNTSSTDSWTYEFQSGEENTVILINQWGAGSSSTDGLPIYSSGDCEVKIEGYVGDGNVLYLYSWALFEGPAYT